jgi:hypothetical protein
MKRAPFVLLALVSALSMHAPGPGQAASAQSVSSPDPAVMILQDGETLIDPTITVKGTSTGNAVAGPYMRDGMTLMTSDVALKTAQDYATRYNGPTEFTANYTIVLKPDNTVDATKSMVTFTTVNYTVSTGPNMTSLVTSNFATQPITITGVTLKNNDPTMITGFTFMSTNWYPANGPAANRLDQKGLSGMINLATGASNYTASYADKGTGAVYTYNVTGMTPAPNPFPDMASGPGNPDIFTPAPDAVPEPATWIVMLAGIAGVACHRLALVKRPGAA